LPRDANDAERLQEQHEHAEQRHDDLGPGSRQRAGGGDDGRRRESEHDDAEGDQRVLQQDGVGAEIDEGNGLAMGKKA
jgi:hypothetical protein